MTFLGSCSGEERRSVRDHSELPRGLFIMQPPTSLEAILSELCRDEDGEGLAHIL